MAHDIKLFKLISGDMVIGKWEEENDKIVDPAILQTVPSQQGGVQMMILPFGYPFDNDIEGEIEGRHIIYKYQNCPEEVQTKYLEASSNLTLSTPGGGLGGMGGGMGGDISNLIK